MNYIRVIDDIFRQFEGPKFSIETWDGQERFYGSGKETAFKLVFKNQATIQRLLSQGSLGFGESYMDGTLQIHGDLDSYFRLRHQYKRVRRSWRLAFAAFLSSRQIPREREQQIAYHYDLGTEFFQMFLDKKTMSYSSGKYDNGINTLEQAQQKKLEFICNWFELPSGSSILDLGSGWGGFARIATQVFNWRVTGYTLSKAQLEYCQKELMSQHLDKLLSFEYRDMTKPIKKKFDGILVLEAIEHVGKDNLSTFFKTTAQALKPGGRLIIQTTGRYQPHRVDRWTLKYVFPGGYLPAKGELFTSASAAGLIIEEFQDDTQSYIRTITEWIKRLESHERDIVKMFDEPFFRLWKLWMHGAKVNFELGEMSLFRLRLRKPK